MILVSYSLLCLLSYMMWWGILIVVTMVGIMKMKFFLSPSGGMMLYFLVQEVCGVFFMMGTNPKILLMMMMIKGGFSPFHNWMNRMLKIMKGQVFIWMLTWQKLPYYFIISMLLNSNFLWFVFLGGVLPLFQVFLSTNFKSILFYLLASSGNNLVIYSFMNLFHLCVIIPFYLFFLFNVVGVINSSGNMFMSVESVFMLMGMPGSISFYVKLTVVSYYSFGGSLFFLMFLLFMLLNLSISINILLNMNYGSSSMNKSMMFLILSMFFIVYL